jgi:hypothetical protein
MTAGWYSGQANHSKPKQVISHYHTQYRRQRLRERSIGFIIFFFLIGFVLFSGAILAYYFIPSPDLLFSTAEEKQRPGNRLVQISMLETDFYIPDSILKRVKQRVFGSVEQIDVQIPWPYDHLAVISGTVEDTTDFRDWVLITFVPRPNRMPPDERYTTVDKYFFAGPPSADPSGLLKYDYKADSPYRDLQLFVDARPGRKTAAIRCDVKASSLGPILCERELPVTAAITARIRFARGHLDEWMEIEGIAANVTRALLRRTMAD